MFPTFSDLKHKTFIINIFLRKSRQEESAKNVNRKLRHSIGCNVFTSLIIVLSAQEEEQGTL